jgi:hypothetical protein
MAFEAVGQPLSAVQRPRPRAGRFTGATVLVHNRPLCDAWMSERFVKSLRAWCIVQTANCRRDGQENDGERKP